MTAKIDIINAMLATTGTLKLSATDSSHPSYIEADLVLDHVLETFNSLELWFNTSKRTLDPDIDGRVVVPSNALWVQPYNSENLSIRGKYLWDHVENTDILDRCVDCKIAIAVPIEDMPPAAIQYIRAMARYEYFLDKDGDPQKVGRYQEIMARSEFNLTSKNAQLSGLNFYKGSAALNFATRRYPSGRNGSGGRLPIR